jgi:hypothetical protein
VTHCPWNQLLPIPSAYFSRSEIPRGLSIALPKEEVSVAAARFPGAGHWLSDELYYEIAVEWSIFCLLALAPAYESLVVDA